MTAAAESAPVRSPIIVAIDGPAGAGKSTVARRLAAALNLPFVDTGAMYRAAALYLLEKGIAADDVGAISKAAAEIPLALSPAAGRAVVLLAGLPVETRIRTPEISELSSRVASHPRLRSRMASMQREFARRYGAVMEGRDIGTVVVPETPFKFFLDADVTTRARRRYDELRGKGAQASLEEIERQIRERDQRDRSRATSPLTAADDAVHVATDGLEIDDVVQELKREVERRSVR